MELLVSLLIVILVVLVIAWAVKVVGGELGVPPRIVQVILVIVAVVFVIYLLRLLLPLAGGLSLP